MIWNMYPYTDFHNMNQDWIIRILKAMEKKLEDFVATNSIKYANPFQWSIVNQYEKNTLVIEPNSGTAYLSVQAVPQGVAISNTDYWTPVFDLSQLITGLNDNFTEHNEQLNLVSSTNYSVGDWIIWKNYLYKVTAAITAGDLLNEGVNIERLTVEDAVKALSVEIDNMTNYVDSKFDAIRVLNIEELGCVGDGVTDNYATFASIISQAASEKLPVYIPAGNFAMSNYITVVDGVEIFGAGDNSIITFNGTNGLLMKNNTSLKNVKVILSSGLMEAVNVNGDSVTIKNCTIKHSHIGIGVYAVKDTLIDGCNIEPYTSSGNFGIWSNVAPYAENVIITNCIINNHVLNGIFANIKGGTISNNTLRGNHTQTSPTGGGQIDIGGTDTETSIVVDSNVIVEGGGSVTGGIEIAGQQMIVSNNIIRKHTGSGYGIAVNYGSHHTITGNMILQNAVGIATGSEIDGLVITGNIFRNNLKDLDIYSDNENVIINNNELNNLGVTSSVMPAIMGVNGVSGNNRNYYNTVANDAQIDLFDPPALGHSYLMEVCVSPGHVLIYEIMPTGAVKFVDPVNWIGTALGTANKINVALSGSRFVLENKLGSSVMLSIRMLEHNYV